MQQSMGCEQQVLKCLSANIADKEHLCSQPSEISPSAISQLTESKTSGLAMLVEKLLVEAKNNISTKHLISTLINRLHYNSITVNASTEEDVKKFILKMLATATHFSKEKGPNKPSNVKAANLLTSAIQKFEINQVDSETLEHEWKEFLFHFYRSRLKEWAFS